MIYFCIYFLKNFRDYIKSIDFIYLFTVLSTTIRLIDTVYARAIRTYRLRSPAYRLCIEYGYLPRAKAKKLKLS